ncbi:hypothetical protein RI129_005228 [Pyrocoelia pectoralis]|uniref:Uncharacterized protein n=1 Tax=Pyrocoelia pectoralis TaxID=417401 RepID=A0AAN7VHW5_9COLE
MSYTEKVIEEVLQNDDKRFQDTLLILKEFNKTVKTKLCQIMDKDDLQGNPHLQDCIQDLTQQNEMLVSVVEELENEAAFRVSMLEEKLQNTSMICDTVMQKYKDNVSINFLKETCQSLMLVQNDVYSLLEFIKRVRQHNDWSTDGLNFHTINPSLLLQKTEWAKSNGIAPKSVDSVQIHAKMVHVSDEPPTQELHFQLRDEELQCVKKSLLEIQDSLLIKVSEKYEENLTLRREVQKLEYDIHLMLQEIKSRDSLIEKMQIQIKLLTQEQKTSADNQHWEEVAPDLKMKENIIEQQATEELEEYKRKYEDIQNALTTLQCEYDAAKVSWQSRIAVSEDEIRMLIRENANIKENRKNCNELVEAIERQEEREKHNQEVTNLKQTILELEKRLNDVPLQTEESSLEQANFTILQQRLTISSLQDALTICKGELEELHQKSVNNFQTNVQLEQKCLIYLQKIRQLNSLIDYLRDANLNLEVNIFEYVQDIAILETQLLKYRLKFKLPNKDLIDENVILNQRIKDLKRNYLAMCNMNKAKIQSREEKQHRRCSPNNDGTELCIANGLFYMDKDIIGSKEQFESELYHSQCTTIRELHSKLDCMEQAYKQLQLEFVNNLQVAQNEITSLNNNVTELRKECCCIRKEVRARDTAVGSVKLSENSQLLMAEEIKVLRNELDKALYQCNVLKGTNDALNLELINIKRIAFDQQNSELQCLRNAKIQLQSKNGEYLKEIEELRCSHAQLQQNYQKVVKSVDILQTEIIDYQNNSENICGESRNVIDNVRHWLEHQSVINQQITQKFNDDQLLIHNLKQKVV